MALISLVEEEPPPKEALIATRMIPVQFCPVAAMVAATWVPCSPESVITPLLAAKS